MFTSARRRTPLSRTVANAHLSFAPCYDTLFEVLFYVTGGCFRRFVGRLFWLFGEVVRGLEGWLLEVENLCQTSEQGQQQPIETHKKQLFFLGPHGAKLHPAAKLHRR